MLSVEHSLYTRPCSKCFARVYETILLLPLFSQTRKLKHRMANLPAHNHRVQSISGWARIWPRQSGFRAMSLVTILSSFQLTPLYYNNLYTVLYSQQESKLCKEKNYVYLAHFWKLMPSLIHEIQMATHKYLSAAENQNTIFYFPCYVYMLPLYLEILEGSSIFIIYL